MDAALAFSRTRSHLLAWFVEQAMPLWSGAGTDWAQGGFHEKLDAAGHPIDEPRRTRVVARQLYVFSVARKLGWQGDAPRWLDHGMRFLLTRLRQPDGTFASSVRPDGQLVNAQFDLYEQAFALFAMASVYRLDPQRHAELPQLSARLLQTLRQGWGHPDTGFQESTPPSVPLRANPHMHLFEAALQWRDALAGTEAQATWQALADELAELALHKLTQPPSGLLTELFDLQWRPLPGQDGRRAEPGHQFEWGWLLSRWGHERHRTDAIEAARTMVDLAERHGLDPARGVAINEIDLALTWLDAEAKLWPQTERIKAWTERAVRAPGPIERTQALECATAAMKGLERYLHHPVAGAWQEVWLKDGQWKAEPTRASSLYHIVCALETLHDAGDLS